MSSAREFHDFYDGMTDGQKVHMANKLWKEDSVVATKLRKYVPRDPIKVGQRWVMGGIVYILANAGGGLVALINLDTGNSRSGTHTVDKQHDLTTGEWEAVTGMTPSVEFVKVEST